MAGGTHILYGTSLLLFIGYQALRFRWLPNGEIIDVIIY